MSTDRYEIRGKIGQGGVGAVYRAYDTQLRREVAMKRVLQEGEMNSEDATANLLKEATALSSVQHPHIVTVYDAGIDAEGPYVVMELINGKTLDEMVERGTLTFEDFKEVAVQSQEAMIAAQELDLVHRDLKPSNVMVSWLPSGRFQVKIVDFGLAKFSAKPSLQTIDHGDAVFGSIFFMAPEQFERTPLDRRTDMYSLGAMYYYALAGEYPFNGDTAPQVMAAHLQNKVPPLAEVRPDLPTWVCDWVMWHIRRDMNDRPDSARAALEHFLAHDSAHTFGVTSTQPLQAAVPTAQLLTPGAPQTAVVPQQTAPQPIMSPSGQANPHTASQQLVQNNLSATATSTPAITPTPTVAVATPATTITTPPANTPQQTTALGSQKNETPTTLGTKKPKISTAKLIAIAVALAVIVIIVALLASGKSEENQQLDTYNQLIEKFNNKPDQNDLQTLTKAELDTLLNCYISQEKSKDESSDGFLFGKNECKAILMLSKPADPSLNIDAAIAEFATQDAVMDEELRKELFTGVLKVRAANILKKRTDADKAIYPWLEKNLAHKAAPAAIQALSPMANESEDFGKMLGLAKKTSNKPLLNEIGNTLSEIVKKSSNKEKLASQLVSLQNTPNKDLKKMLTKVATHTGSKEVLPMLSAQLDSSKVIEVKDTFNALQSWPNRDAIDIIVEKVRKLDSKNPQDKLIRLKGLKAAATILKKKNIKALPDNLEHWQKLVNITDSDPERRIIISSLASIPKKWALDLLRILKSEVRSDTLIDSTQSAIEKVESRIENAKN